MNKSLQVVVLLCAFALLQSCGPKSSEDSSTMDSTATITDADSENAPAELAAVEDVAVKRARIEKERVEKAEQRALAVAEKAKANLTYKDASGKIVYNKAEVDPAFTGGEKEMRKYLRQNLKYPEAARDKGVEGTVFVEFVVDASGNVREVVAADVVGEDVDQALKDESVRVVTAMPKWVAGRQHGKSVDASFSIPISFELSN
jgi:TonB family protein